MRAAKIGDRGMIFGWTMSPGSGLGQLLMKPDPDKEEFLFINGDWRPISQIAEALDGQEVEVVEAEGSPYGCHAVQPLEMAV